MEFDIEKFEATNFKDRIEKIPVPALKAFFKLEEEEEPVWTIRGLTSEELALSTQAVQNNKNLDAILQAVGSSVKKEKIDGIKELAGLSSDRVPEELVKKYSWVKHGSINPVCSDELVKKLALNFPTEFHLISNKIMILTGQGRLGE